MKQRLFVALSISDNLKEQILAWQKKYNHLPVRWIKSENLHITLIPPWYEENLKSKIENLGSLKKLQPMTLNFNKIEFGPTKYQPRLIWTSGETPKELPFLKEKLETILERKAEKRHFLTHLTIARFRPEHFANFPIKELNEEIAWQDKIDSLILFESILKRTGAEYMPLVRINL